MELSCGAKVSVEVKGTGVCLAFAKEELTTHLEKMFTKITFTNKLPETRILLSVRHSPLIRHDGYQIVITEKQVHISASQPRGVLHGVYHFLRLLGCSFWFSKAAVQNVPTVRRKTLETGVIVENPMVKTRGICLFGATKKTASEVLATIDFMAKNGYNLLMTTPCKRDKLYNGEHDIIWDEISDVVLPHLIKRGIDITLAFDETIPGGQPIKAKNMASATNEEIKIIAENLIKYLENKPYITMIGPWKLNGNCESKGNESSLCVHKKNEMLARIISEARPDLTLIHTACNSVCPNCEDEAMPSNMAVMLTEKQNAFEWCHGKKAPQGTFLLDRAMGDSFKWDTNLWIQPYHAKYIVAAAANASCDGVISIWSPISSWRIAAMNFAFLREAYYHPDYSVDGALKKLCEDLWGVMGPTLYNAIHIAITGLQDLALWSRPPRAPQRVFDHTTQRNKIFDSQNAETFEKRYKEIFEIIDGVNIARLDEHGRYHLDCFKLYLKMQREFFMNVDQYCFETDTPEKAEGYYKLLDETFVSVGEGFVLKSYASTVFKQVKIFDKNKKI